MAKSRALLPVVAWIIFSMLSGGFLVSLLHWNGLSFWGGGLWFLLWGLNPCPQGHFLTIRNYLEYLFWTYTHWSNMATLPYYLHTPGNLVLLCGLYLEKLLLVEMSCLQFCCKLPYFSQLKQQVFWDLRPLTIVWPIIVAWYIIETIWVYPLSNHP